MKGLADDELYSIVRKKKKKVRVLNATRGYEYDREGQRQYDKAKELIKEGSMLLSKAMKNRY